jgi:glycine/D-amino acid oxidase-like deaminating enzyme/nitrite reductase/ring-hydroxylating ferredoxin subunit
MNKVESTPWKVPPLPLVPLEAEISTDVAVVGGGIAGMATAYHLALAGLDVTVLEAGEVGSGETGRTTAHLASAVDDRFVRIEALHGGEAARLCASSHAAAIDRFEWIAQSEGIDCGFRRVNGYLILSEEDKPDKLQSEQTAARRAGLSAEWMSRFQPDRVDMGPALQFARQAQIDPGRFLTGLTQAVLARGVRVHTRTRVVDVERSPHPRLITERGEKVNARRVVIATNAPINTLVKFHTKEIAYRTHAVALRYEGPFEDLCWDTGLKDRGYRYVRTSGQGFERMLIVGGEDHRTGQADDAPERWARLEAWARARFACGGTLHRWSGQVLEPVDSLAFIGRSSRDDDRIFVITGDSGMGMTHSMIGAMLLRDLMTGVPNPWEELYSPSRITLRAADRYAGEALNTFGQYLEWLRPPRAGENELPEPGHGAVITRGLKPLAVYRRPDGTMQVHSAVCQHLGCIVAWNSVAKSWDCPCHGSRYAADGAVLNGPTTEGLKPASLDEPDHPAADGHSANGQSYEIPRRAMPRPQPG